VTQRNNVPWPGLPALLPAPRDEEDRLIEDLCGPSGSSQTGPIEPDRAETGDVLPPFEIGEQPDWPHLDHRASSLAAEAGALAAGLTLAGIALACNLSPMAAGIAGLLAACASGFADMPALTNGARHRSALPQRRHGDRHG